MKRFSFSPFLCLYFLSPSVRAHSHLAAYVDAVADFKWDLENVSQKCGLVISQRFVTSEQAAFSSIFNYQKATSCNFSTASFRESVDDAIRY